MQDFLRHINLENQKFKCYVNTDEEETITLTVDIHNILNDAASENEISLLRKLIPHNNGELIDFYTTHNGIKLYCNNDTSGIEFYAAKDLNKLNEMWKEELAYFEDYQLYDFQKGGVAFGEISHSGNYFVLFEGAVFYSDHDGEDEEAIGATFFDFLSKIADNPADLLFKMGCYTRYSDGKTNKQYIPKEFATTENL
ncbi:MAG: SMI1/KNR4 family protein [Agriterribacter sp.]